MAEIHPLRIGKISSINYKAGAARVAYEDRDGGTTPELPFIAWEYWMPRIGDQVLVGHLSNGSTNGVILGPIWSSGHAPYAHGANYYRHELSNTPNQAAIVYDGSTGLLKIRAEYIGFDDYDAGTLLTVADIRSGIAALQRRCTSLEARVTALGG